MSTAVEVERLKADLREAYAERDQQFERKAKALRERDDARRELAEARKAAAPVTAEDLRERLIARLESEPLFGTGEIVDAVLAELAGDPGDLPARMAEAIDETWTSEENFDAQKAAAAAMSVRWEHAARQAAEAERLRAELDEMEGVVTDLGVVRLELQAERDLLTTKVEQIYAVDREAMAMIRAERDALTTELGHAQGTLTDARGEIDALTRENRRQREELATAEATIERAENHLKGIEAHCSANRLDVPSWVGSVRAALSVETTTTPVRETA